MADWAINTRTLNESQDKVTIQQRRKPSISIGDRVLLFEKRNEEIHFIAVASVEDLLPEESVASTFGLMLGSKRDFEPQRRLVDFTYTLKKINRHNAPWVHFTRQYILLATEDFNCLLNASIFWSRTAFGTYINMLPAATLVEFVESIGAQSPTTLITGRFSDLWELLRKFIFEEFVAAHTLFSEINRLGSQIQETYNTRGILSAFQFREVSLSNEGGLAADNVVEQFRRLDTFINMTSLMSADQTTSFDVFEELSSRIEEHQDEEFRFETSFRGTPWPTHKISL